MTGVRTPARGALRNALACGRARKSRWRRSTTDNYSGFQLIDPYRNWIVACEKFNLTAEAVVEYCARDSYRGSTGQRR
jgi:hypothetical protein